MHAAYLFKIAQQDLDFTRRLSISSFLRYILSTAGMDAQKNGFGIKELEAQQHTWVLSRVAFECDRLPALDEAIEIQTWVSSCGRVLTTRNFLVYDEAGVLIASAVTQWCMINLETRAVINLAGRYDVKDAEPSPIEKVRKIQTKGLVCVARHQVVYSDIDFNRHVNTMRYINMMLDQVPLDCLQSIEHLRGDIHFVSECKFGESLKIKALQQDEMLIFEIAREDDSSSVKASFELLPPSI